MWCDGWGALQAEIEEWKQRFLSGAENALRSRPLDDEAQPNRDIKRLKQNVGELVMDLDIGHPLGEGGHQGPPFGAADARRVKHTVPTASTRAICRVLGVARSALDRHQPSTQVRVPTRDDAALVTRIHELIQQHPTYGYRRIWARLRFGDKHLVNRKKVYRLMKACGWMVEQRAAAPKPRVTRKKSVATRRNERWALDTTHIHCGADGWGHLVAVID